MSFQKGISMFEIVRLFQRSSQRSEDDDIFDFSEDDAGRCCFYGRNEVFAWLIAQSRSSIGYGPTIEEQLQLALNVARNTQHNGPELVRTALAKVDPKVALRAKNAEGITLLHRVASRLGGGFGYEANGMEKFTIFLDDGFDLPCHPADKELLSRDGWRSFLHGLDLKDVDTHPISKSELTPMMMGFRTLVRVWMGSSSKQIEALSTFLQLWLSDLNDSGIDLLLYGEEEKRLQDSELVCKDFHRHSKKKVDFNGSEKAAKAINDAYGTLRLISFETDPSPAKWRLWWSEPTDEFAGDFWRMCERLPTTTPGAWRDDLLVEIL